MSEFIKYLFGLEGTQNPEKSLPFHPYETVLVEETGPTRFTVRPEPQDELTESLLLLARNGDPQDEDVQIVRHILSCLPQYTVSDGVPALVHPQFEILLHDTPDISPIQIISEPQQDKQLGQSVKVVRASLLHLPDQRAMMVDLVQNIRPKYGQYTDRTLTHMRTQLILPDDPSRFMYDIAVGVADWHSDRVASPYTLLPGGSFTYMLRYYDSRRTVAGTIIPPKPPRKPWEHLPRYTGEDQFGYKPDRRDIRDDDRDDDGDILIPA